eukprot:NODE_3757_length_735_cov_38.069971_g3160_i0.p1 GENE.NODE_3757_length_735_cov_38.069971_g3160_i0~~NODE_3757_length_735_cov_38.069971_g3160_i0.p1  ORF type:complete len:244 (+),score=69.18 NODE_3757_length_735_cov_38.069971_g3160_i0:92-733(+)
MGYFWKDMKHGRGVYLFANGSQYKGNWFEGRMHGWGSFVEQATGDRFEGEWSYGERQFGTYYYANKDIYHGGFKNSMKQGRGVVWEKRVMYEAIYDQDICVDKRQWSTEVSLEEGANWGTALSQQQELMQQTTTANRKLHRKNVLLNERVMRLQSQLVHAQEQLRLSCEGGPRGNLLHQRIHLQSRSPNQHTHPHHHRKTSLHSRNTVPCTLR